MQSDDILKKIIGQERYFGNFCHFKLLYVAKLIIEKNKDLFNLS